MERSETWKAFAAPASPFGALASRRAPSAAQLTFVDWQQPIGCGGVAIFPDDILIADQDGAVVVPKEMAQDILESSRETEALEEWILEQVNAGRKLPERGREGGVSILEIPALAAKRVSVKRPGGTNEPTS